MIEESGAGSVPLTNGSGSGRPNHTDPQHYRQYIILAESSYRILAFADLFFIFALLASLS
jgi:hypothetical protein